MLQIADEHMNDLRQKLDREQRQHGDLRRDYEKVVCIQRKMKAL
jgi:hypothetical protein